MFTLDEARKIAGLPTLSEAEDWNDKDDLDANGNLGKLLKKYSNVDAAALKAAYQAGYKDGYNEK